MTESTQKSGRGGARKGAGRKPTGRKYHVMSVTGSKEELDAIRRKAAAAGKTVSRFLLDAAFASS